MVFLLLSAGFSSKLIMTGWEAVNLYSKLQLFSTNCHIKKPRTLNNYYVTIICDIVFFFVHLFSIKQNV